MPKRNFQLMEGNLDRASKHPKLSTNGQVPAPKSFVLFEQYLPNYHLNYPSDPQVYHSEIYNEKSPFFSADHRPKFQPADYLPYSGESHHQHLEQARYLCYILVNLYLSIGSLDIQGIVGLSRGELLLGNGNHQLRQSERGSVTSESEDDIVTVDDDDNEEEEEEDNDDIDYTDTETQTQTTDLKEFGSMGPTEFNASGKLTLGTPIIINVNYWTNELKNCLHFQFPLSLRKKLVTVCYYLSLVQGQKVHRQLFVEVLESLVSTDDRGINYTRLLREHGLRLDPEPLFKFLSEFLPYPDPDYVRYDSSASREDLNLFRLLLKLAHITKSFFDFPVGSKAKSNFDIDRVMEYILSSVSPSTTQISFPLLTSFVPYFYYNNKMNETVAITDYLPICFSIWGSNNATIAIDTHMYDFIGNIAEDAHSKIIGEWGVTTTTTTTPDTIPWNLEYGIFTREQLTFMFNRLQGHLRTNGQIHSFSRTVRPFVYSINGKHNEFFFTNLGNLARSIETYVHPSNTGFWTKPIAKFIHAFIKMYHERAQRELKYPIGDKVSKLFDEMYLDTSCHDSLVDIFFKLLFIGAQNKVPSIANYYISCFAYLVDLKPSTAYRIFDKILVDLYDSLSDEYINSRHRIIASLKQFGRVVRYMVQHSVYRVHITNVLSMLVSKIDTNDISLTSNIINVILSIGSFVPLEKPHGDELTYLSFESNTLPFIQQHYYHLKNGGSTDAEFESELRSSNDSVIREAFWASTIPIDDILRVYIDKLFQLVDVELNEGLVTKVNQTTIVLIQSMSKPTFDKFASEFIGKFWDNDAFNERDPNYELATITLSALVKRDSGLVKPTVIKLMDSIREQLQRGAGSVRSTSEIQNRDVKLVLYLTAFNDVLLQAHETLLNLSDELVEFVLYLLEKISNPPIDVIVSIISHSICSSLTITEIRDTLLFREADSDADPSIEMSLEDKWGGMQFDDRKFEDSNMQFEWHIPTEAEIKLAIEIFIRITDHCMNAISNLMDTPQGNPWYSDEIQKYLLTITHALSGSSLLFDPDFDRLKEWKNSGAKMSELDKFLSGDSGGSGDPSYDIPDQGSGDVTNGENEEFDDNKLNVQVQAHSQAEDVEAGERAILDLDIEHDGGDGGVLCSSDVPSRIVTPCGHLAGDTVDDNNNSNININDGNGRNEPGSPETVNDVVFKELDIFSCNYPFGKDPAEKIKNELYLKVNNHRVKIGEFFHKVFLFFVSNSENNVNTFQTLLHGLKVWFSDVGQETILSDDASANLDVDLLESVQSLHHLETPFTRTLLAAKINNYHQTRVLLHSTTRQPSATEKQLLDDIITLSFSIYPDIHKPAQGCLSHCMKRIIGSYSMTVTRLIKALRDNLDAVDSLNFRQIEVILQMFFFKRIMKKLGSDYKHLEEIILLLVRCSKINEMQIGSFAEKSLTELFSNVKIPSSICVHSPLMYTPLMPPSDPINQKVKLIKSLKRQKARHFVSCLIRIQDKLMSLLDTELTWKIRMLIVRFITRLQSSLETQATGTSVKAIFDQTRDKHPQMVHLVIRSLLSIFNKVFSLFDYGYDISRAYQSDYDPPFIKNIDTVPTSESFSSEFKREMANISNQNFFIDSKAFVGWLCWGRPMKALQPRQIEISLQQNEVEVAKVLGKLVTREWLDEITTCLVNDNETRSVFNSGDVSFFVLLIILITKGYTDNLSLEDLFSLCRKHYDRDDKAAMIMSAEIVAGLISGSKYMKPSEITLRDDFMAKFLEDCLDHELSQDSFEIWSTLCWWLPSVVDLRRCKPFYNYFSRIKGLTDAKLEDASHQASVMNMVDSILTGLDMRSPSMESLLSDLVFDHPHDQLRAAIGKLFSTMCQTQDNPSFESVESLLGTTKQSNGGLGVVLRRAPAYINDRLVQIFTSMAKEEAAVISKELSPQQIVKTRYFYLASTMCYWLQDMLRSPSKVTWCLTLSLTFCRSSWDYYVREISANLVG